MTKVRDATERYLERFDQLDRTSPAFQCAWLRTIRKAALAQFAELGFPTTDDEEWRYTNVTPIVNAEFGYSEPVAVSTTDVEPYLFGRHGEAHVLVLVNGRGKRECSSVQALPPGVKVCHLGSALGEFGKILEPHLGRHSRYQDQAFGALNLALFEDGAFVYVPKNTRVENPIHLVFLASPGTNPVAFHPRILVVAEEGSEVGIVETYCGTGPGVSWTNTVTELVVGDNAKVDHYKVTRESSSAFHTGVFHVHQYRDSVTSSLTVSLDGGLVRHDLNATLDGEGGDCVLNGLYYVNGTRHVDNHIRVEHAQAHCNSREFFKGILDGAGRGIFTGRIVVRPGAQKTDAKQTNMSLLLSQEALVESKPQLEIFADDVKCTHGATIGQVDEDAVFYLRSRGIDVESARALLVHAFAAESLERVHIAPLRAQLEGLFLAALPGGAGLREGTP